MALGTPQGVTFSKAARYYIPKKTCNNNDNEEAKEEKKQKKKKLKSLKLYLNKQSERKRNWKLSHTAWRWQTTMIYGILETETELRRKRNTVKTRENEHQIGLFECLGSKSI